MAEEVSVIRDEGVRVLEEQPKLMISNSISNSERILWGWEFDVRMGELFTVWGKEMLEPVAIK